MKSMRKIGTVAMAWGWLVAALASGGNDDLLKPWGQSAAKVDFGLLAPDVRCFAFEYDGHSSDTLLEGWTKTLQTTTTNGGKQYVYCWDDPATGLRAEWTLLVYDAYPAVEMRLAFENRGIQAAGPLRKVQVIRQKTTRLPVEVICATGGLGNWLLEPVTESIPANFQPSVKRIQEQSTLVRISARDGWSSNHHLPFWLLMSPDGSGFYYGLGWTGQWAATFTSGPGSVLTTEAGMEHLSLRLQPGERISQPSVLMGYFTGGRWAGHNALRRILYEQYTALLDGKKVLPPTSFNHWFGFGGNDVNEDKMRQAVQMLAPLGIEYCCLDAGWYNVDFWQAGDWRVNAKKFPNGLEPVAEAIQANGMKMGLWFDPERVTDAAYEAFPRKELLIPARKEKQPAAENAIRVWLLDLSKPEASAWAVDLIADYAKRLNLGWIRYDFNYPPLEMWLYADADTPDRLGMKEIRYVEGLYRMLDGLNQRCPGLLIEWCAGGGRRIDLETLRRTHTQWKSDITGDGDITRPHLTGGNLFLPGNTMNSNLIRLDSEYDYYCQFGGPLGFGHDFRGDGTEKIAQAAKLIARYKELRRFLVEDYYPLFGDYVTDGQKWDGWQFHDPRKNEGFFVVFRLPDSPYNEATVKLYGLVAGQTYRLTAEGSGQVTTNATGKAMMNGLAVRIPGPRQVVLVQYSAEK